MQGRVDMRGSLSIGFGVILLVAGCQLHPPRPVPLNYSRYHQKEFQWAAVNRVVLMPLVNETEHPRAAVEMLNALSAEMQRMGLFEVVVAPIEPYEQLSRKIRSGGRFDESELVEIARCFRADVIVMGTLSQYRPYQRPCVGLVLQAVSPDTGKVIASVDGLWDSTSHSVASRAQRYYMKNEGPIEKVCDYVQDKIDPSYAAELVLDSPSLFRRFVAYEVMAALVLKLIPLDALPHDHPLRGGGQHFKPKPAFGTFPLAGPIGRLLKICTFEKPKDKSVEEPRKNKGGESPPKVEKPKPEAAREKDKVAIDPLTSGKTPAPEFHTPPATSPLPSSGSRHPARSVPE